MDDVAGLLRTWELDRYEDLFREGSICGEMLGQLTDEDLQEMKVTSRLHRKKVLLKKATKMKTAHNQPLIWRLARPY